MVYTSTKIFGQPKQLVIKIKYFRNLPKQSVTFLCVSFTTFLTKKNIVHNNQHPKLYQIFITHQRKNFIRKSSTRKLDGTKFNEKVGTD